MKPILLKSKLKPKPLDAPWMAYQAIRQFKKGSSYFTSAAGHIIRDLDGRKIFDGLSGLLTCGLGHSVPAIDEAVAEQVKKRSVDYSPAFQYGHENRSLVFLLWPSKSLNSCQQVLNEFLYGLQVRVGRHSTKKVAAQYWRKKAMGTQTKFYWPCKGLSMVASVSWFQCRRYSSETPFIRDKARVLSFTATLKVTWYWVY